MQNQDQQTQDFDRLVKAIKQGDVAEALPLIRKYSGDKAFFQRKYQDWWKGHVKEDNLLILSLLPTTPVGPEIVSALVQAAPELLSEHGSSGYYPIHIACERSQLENIRILLVADPNAYSCDSIALYAVRPRLPMVMCQSLSGRVLLFLSEFNRLRVNFPNKEDEEIVKMIFSSLNLFLSQRLMEGLKIFFEYWLQMRSVARNMLLVYAVEEVFLTKIQATDCEYPHFLWLGKPIRQDLHLEIIAISEGLAIKLTQLFSSQTSVRLPEKMYDVFHVLTSLELPKITLDNKTGIISITRVKNVVEAEISALPEESELGVGTSSGVQSGGIFAESAGQTASDAPSVYASDGYASTNLCDPGKSIQ